MCWYCRPQNYKLNGGPTVSGCQATCWGQLWSSGACCHTTWTVATSTTWCLEPTWSIAWVAYGLNVGFQSSRIWGAWVQIAGLTYSLTSFQTLHLAGIGEFRLCWAYWWADWGVAALADLTNDEILGWQAVKKGLATVGLLEMPTGSRSWSTPRAGAEATGSHRASPSLSHSHTLSCSPDWGWAWVLGCTKKSKSFRNLIASWYILYWYV